MGQGIEYSDIAFAAFGLALLAMTWAIMKFGPALLRWFLMKLYDLFLRNKKLEQ